MAAMKRTSLRKSRPLLGNTSIRTWRDHPLVVGAIVGAATLTLMGGVVFPLLTAHFSAEIVELRKVIDAKSEQIGGLRNQVERLEREIAEGKQTVQKLEKQKEEIAETLRHATLENPFVLPSGYPKGLDEVRVGARASDVETVYSELFIDKKEEDYWSVKVTHPVFASATYYFDSKSRLIYQVLFQLNYDGPIKDEDMLQLAKRYLGASRVSIGGNHLWVTSSKERISIDNHGGFLIMGGDDLPKWVVKAFSRCSRSEPIADGDVKVFCERFGNATKLPERSR